MEPPEYIFVIVLTAMNLIAGVGCAIPIARWLGKVAGRPARLFRYFAMLIGIYFVECVAFPMGMCTQIFTIGLSFVWGIVFGLWLRGQAPAREVLKQAFFVSIYDSLPTASFCILLLMSFIIGGDNILTSEAGRGFGIPHFVRWPLNTILGFCSALMIGTVVFKTVITTGEVSLLVHLGKRKIHKK